MARFEWQTEEEEAAWEEVDQWPPEPPPDRGPGRRWLALLVTLLMVGSVIFFFYRQVDERVTDVTADVELEVLASHDIVRYAAEQRDPEMLITFLSGRDPAWSQVQQSLVETGTLFDRQSLGLHLLPAGPPERAALSDHREVISVTLSPELTEATVSVAQAYAVGIGNGVTETIYLQQDSLYRKGEDRWLYAAPEDDPIEAEEVGNYVVLHYDQQEGEVARRLAGDLDRKVGELCNLPETECPSGYRVYVVMVKDPEILGRLMDPATFLHDSALPEGRRDQTIRLPAPSLVGMPLDEDAYRALYRGYSAQVLRAVLTWQAWSWECCDHAPIFQALVDQQLVRLGVQVSPLSERDYEQLLQKNFALLEDTMLSWYGRQFAEPDSRGWVEGQAVVDFLLTQNPQVSLAAMAKRLNEAANFWFWTYEFLEHRISDAELTEAWLQFAYEQAGLSQGEPAAEWPTADAMLLCGTNYATNQQLYRYDMEANRLVEMTEGRTFLDLQPLPAAEGALLIEAGGGGNEREIQLSLWRHGALMPLWNSRETNVSLSYNWLALDNSGERLTMAVEGREGVTHILLDLASCLQGECYAEVLPGRLIWSPDGAHSLIVQEAQLLLADGQGEIIRPVVSGTFNSPFWLDEGTFGYLRRPAREENGPPAAELVSVAIQDETVQVLLAVEDLADFLPLGPEVYHLTSVTPNPVTPDELLLQVIDYTSSSSAAGLFAFDRATGEVTHLFDSASWWAPVVAPNGRWLALPSFDRVLGQSAVLLHEPASGRQMRIPQRETSAFAWSPDGRWLLSTGGSVLHLVAPDDEYRQVLVHSEKPCRAVAWVK